MVPSPLLEVFRKHVDVALGAAVGLSQILDLMMLEAFSNLNDPNSHPGEGTPGWARVPRSRGCRHWGQDISCPLCHTYLCHRRAVQGASSDQARS